MHTCTTLSLIRSSASGEAACKVTAGRRARLGQRRRAAGRGENEETCRVGVRNLIAPDVIERGAPAYRLIEAAQRQRGEMKIEWDGVADLSGAGGVVPLGYVAQVQVPGGPAEMPGAGAEQGREDQGQAAGTGWKRFDLWG